MRRCSAGEGDNYFSGPAPDAPVATRLMQGAIERSNVSGVTELTTHDPRSAPTSRSQA